MAAHVYDLIRLLKNQTVYIQPHNFPDPDAIASAFGLQEFLAFHEIPAVICYDGRIERLSSKKMLNIFDIQMFLGEALPNMHTEDYIVLVDAQKLNANVSEFAGTIVASVDHHPTHIEIEYRYHDLRIVGATASLIASYFHETQTPIHPKTAAALAYGIKIDTADFIRGVTQMDVDMFAWLHSQADWSLIKSMYSDTLEFGDLTAFRETIQNLKIMENTCFAYIPFQVPPHSIAIISDYLLGLDGVKIAVIYAIQHDGIRFSIRSMIPDIPAGKLIQAALAHIGNGGGHASMAGGIIPTENVPRLGDNLHLSIEGRFLRAEAVIKAAL